MMPSTESATYHTRITIFLHWFMALAILGMLTLGWGFDYLPKGEVKLGLIGAHKSIGIVILFLGIARLARRMAHHARSLPAIQCLWGRRIASTTHILLYVAVIGLPLSGWMMVSASPRNIPTVLFDILPWPNLPILPTLENRGQITRYLLTAHWWMSIVLAALIAGHAMAALRHHFISRDDTLLRMMPRLGGKRPANHA